MPVIGAADPMRISSGPAGGAGAGDGAGDGAGAGLAQPLKTNPSITTTTTVIKRNFFIIALFLLLFFNIPKLSTLLYHIYIGTTPLQVHPYKITTPPHPFVNRLALP